jgi:CheY-like chemotaxis protein
MYKVFSPSNEDSAGGAANREIPGTDGDVESGVILVVDDEDMVREVAQMMLESFGYTVLAAVDGLEGLRLLKAHERIDAVLLDLTMPRMSGEETFREIHRLRPTLPIILVSGYNEQEVNDQFISQQIAGFIQKPFQLSELMDKLRDAIAKNKGQKNEG